MSGLSRTPGKRVWANPHRGFESRPLRHDQIERGTLAQLVEQRTFNPLVTSSNLVRPTINLKKACPMFNIGQAFFLFAGPTRAQFALSANWSIK